MPAEWETLRWELSEVGRWHLEMNFSAQQNAGLVISYYNYKYNYIIIITQNTKTIQRL